MNFSFKRLVPALALVCFSCQIEKLDPDHVAEGVARLSVRNAANLLSLVNADTQCGFSSKGVADSLVISGTPLGTGTGTATVKDCVLTLPENFVLSTDCNGVKTTVSGKVTVSGTRVMTGTITGGKENPVVPVTPDAVVFQITAHFDNFEVRSTNSNKGMRQISGGFSFTAKPPLAAAASNGICSVVTNEVAISDLTYESGSKVFVDAGDRKFPVDVNGSSMMAQVGSANGKENYMEGTTKVWDTTVKLPLKDTKDGLDPDYKAADFLSSYACTKDLSSPVSRTCGTLEQLVVEGASRLSVGALGRIAKLMGKDTTCGFESEAVKATREQTGPTGGRGTVTWNLGAAGCTLEFKEPYVLGTDCNGLNTLMQGKLTVTGTKTVTGLVTGSASIPAVPTSRDGVVLSIVAKPENFKIWDSKSPNAITIKNGTLSGDVKPRLAIDTTTGACSIDTPVVSLESIHNQNTDLMIDSEQGSFALTISNSDLTGQQGSKDGRTNALSGNSIVNGKSFVMPSTLDPYFDATTFDATYACVANQKIPATEGECSMMKTLGENAARLIVQAIGSTAKMVNADSSCGFENTIVKARPETVEGDVGQQGKLTWLIEGCALGGATTQISTDCYSGGTFVGGTATVDVRRTVTGLRETQFLIFDSIIPGSNEAVKFDFVHGTFANFESYSIDGGKTEPAGKLLLNGAYSGTVMPIMQAHKSEVTRFDIPTAGAVMTSLQLVNARATLSVGDLKFDLDIPTANINATNGTWRGASNILTGSIQIGSETVQLNTPLMPDFTQAKFDGSYACTPDILGVVTSP